MGSLPACRFGRHLCRPGHGAGMPREPAGRMPALRVAAGASPGGMSSVRAAGGPLRQAGRPTLRALMMIDRIIRHKWWLFALILVGAMLAFLQQWRGSREHSQD